MNRCLIFSAILSGLAAGLLIPLIASANGAPSGWQLSNTSGFGNADNESINTLTTWGSQLYAGTTNSNGAQVWRTSDAQTWTQFTTSWNTANVEVLSANPFGDYLYFGTGRETGGEIWRTNGAGWQKVADGGLADSNNYGFTAMSILTNTLYIASANVPPIIGGSGNGVEVYRSTTGNSGSWTQVNSSGFDKGSTWPDVSMDVFQGKIYLGVSRVTSGGGSLAELWRYDGISWTAVFTDGLGFSSNTHLPAMAEFNGYFYITLRNTTTGGQLWRSANGSNWTPVFTDGLAQPGNSRPYGLIVHNNHLVLVFCNVGNGAETWSSRDGLNWLPLSVGGWGDSENAFADYFDKGAAIFRGMLFIGTMNQTSGGQVWQRLFTVSLPLALR